MARDREFIISLKRLEKFDSHSWMVIKHKYTEPEIEEIRNHHKEAGMEFDYDAWFKFCEGYKRYMVMAIIDGEFYDILFAQEGNRCHVYFVKELKGHYTYRSVFGSKRHGIKTTGYEVYYHKDFTKEEGNKYYQELNQKLFKSSKGKMFVKVDF